MAPPLDLDVLPIARCAARPEMRNRLGCDHSPAPKRDRSSGVSSRGFRASAIFNGSSGMLRTVPSVDEVITD